MKVLLIEDDMNLVGKICQHLSGSDPRIEITVATNRSKGIFAIESEEFDFIICDLRIPPREASFDARDAHGLAVHSTARHLCPGTPCLFFTGFATDRNVSEQLSSGGTYDIFGTGKPFSMTQLLKKDELTSCIKLLEDFSSELSILGAIRIDYLEGTRDLDKMEKRALRIYARPLGGTNVEAETLRGLSGARTIRARVRDDKGHLVASQFVKIAPRVKLEKELENYRKHVGPLLSLGRFPSLEEIIDAGIGKRMALFYQFAEEYPDDLFDVLSESDCEAAAMVELLRDTLKPWMDKREERLLCLREFREGRIDSAKLRPFLNALGPIEALEEVKGQVRISCQHGDLHGFNVLCNASGKAVVLDFGNVGPAPACLDPVILEQSVLFHSRSPFRNSPWPTIEQTEVWFNIEEYLRNCPIPNFIKKCREWAVEVGGSPGFPWVVYSEALRQLKFDDTDHDRALGIARAAVREMSFSTMH